jgi:hypothetical protein
MGLPLLGVVPETKAVRLDAAAAAVGVATRAVAEPARKPSAFLTVTRMTELPGREVAEVPGGSERPGGRSA